MVIKSYMINFFDNLKLKLKIIKNYQLLQKVESKANILLNSDKNKILISPKKN